MSTGDDLVAQARRVLGKPYLFGAEGPNAFDCSGLVKWCADNIGITACPRTSEAQFAWGQSVTTPAAGDLVFFVGAEPDPPPGHVGIVVAPGQMIEAPHTGSVVMQAGYGLNGTGTSKFMGYRRLQGLPGGAGVSSGSAAGTSQQQIDQQNAVAAIGSYVAVIGIVIFLIVALAIVFLFVFKVVLS